MRWMIVVASLVCAESAKNFCMAVWNLVVILLKENFGGQKGLEVGGEMKKLEKAV